MVSTTKTVVARLLFQNRKGNKTWAAFDSAGQHTLQAFASCFLH